MCRWWWLAGKSIVVPRMTFAHAGLKLGLVSGHSRFMFMIHAVLKKIDLKLIRLKKNGTKNRTKKPRSAVALAVLGG
jgi:hypothetical protein